MMNAVAYTGMKSRLQADLKQEALLLQGDRATHLSVEILQLYES